ncbi:MAG: hypothetical protein MJ252_20515 [archaeon]|nr:hypothetical protein [archaeon]
MSNMKKNPNEAKKIFDFKGDYPMDSFSFKKNASASKDPALVRGKRTGILFDKEIEGKDLFKNSASIDSSNSNIKPSRTQKPEYKSNRGYDPQYFTEKGSDDAGNKDDFWNDASDSSDNDSPSHDASGTAKQADTTQSQIMNKISQYESSVQENNQTNKSKKSKKSGSSESSYDYFKDLIKKRKAEMNIPKDEDKKETEEEKKQSEPSQKDNTINILDMDEESDPQKNTMSNKKPIHRIDNISTIKKPAFSKFGGDSEMGDLAPILGEDGENGQNNIQNPFIQANKKGSKKDTVKDNSSHSSHGENIPPSFPKGKKESRKSGSSAQKKGSIKSPTFVVKEVPEEVIVIDDNDEVVSVNSKVETVKQISSESSGKILEFKTNQVGSKKILSKVKEAGFQILSKKKEPKEDDENMEEEGEVIDLNKFNPNKKVSKQSLKSNENQNFNDNMTVSFAPQQKSQERSKDDEINSQGNPEENPEDIPQDIKGDIPGDNPNINPQDNPMDIPQDDVPQDNPMDIPQDNPIDVPKDNIPQDVPKDDVPKDNIPQDVPQEVPSFNPLDIPQDNIPKDNIPHDVPDFNPSEIPHDNPSAAGHNLMSNNNSSFFNDLLSDFPKDAPKDVPKDAPKENKKKGKNKDKKKGKSRDKSKPKSSDDDVDITDEDKSKKPKGNKKRGKSRKKKSTDIPVLEDSDEEGKAVSTDGSEISYKDVVKRQQRENGDKLQFAVRANKKREGVDIIDYKVDTSKIIGTFANGRYPLRIRVPRPKKFLGENVLYQNTGPGNIPQTILSLDRTGMVEKHKEHDLYMRNQEEKKRKAKLERESKKKSQEEGEDKKVEKKKRGRKKKVILPAIEEQPSEDEDKPSEIEEDQKKDEDLPEGFEEEGEEMIIKKRSQKKESKSFNAVLFIQIVDPSDNFEIIINGNVYRNLPQNRMIEMPGLSLYSIRNYSKKKDLKIKFRLSQK